MRAALALAAVLVVAGCGDARQAPPPKPPPIPKVLSDAWRAQSDAVAAALSAGDGCLAQQQAAALQASVIAAVNAHRVPVRYQETLLGSVNDLASRIACIPPPPPKKHGRGDGHGKHKGHDD